MWGGQVVTSSSLIFVCPISIECNVLNINLMYLVFLAIYAALWDSTIIHCNVSTWGIYAHPSMPPVIISFLNYFCLFSPFFFFFSLYILYIEMQELKLYPSLIFWFVQKIVSMWACVHTTTLPQSNYPLITIYWLSVYTMVIFLGL